MKSPLDYNVADENYRKWIYTSVKVVDLSFLRTSDRYISRCMRKINYGYKPAIPKLYTLRFLCYTRAYEMKVGEITEHTADCICPEIYVYENGELRRKSGKYTYSICLCQLYVQIKCICSNCDVCM